MSYVPLHVHSGYAFGRSSILAEEIAVLSAAGGCPAALIADPHAMVGVVEFSRACRREGIKPIIGATIELPEGGEIVLLAKSKRGYQSLSRLISECHLEEPRLFPLGSWERIQRHASDLICLTGGDAGPVNRQLMRRDDAGAQAMLARLTEVYGPHNVMVQCERSYLPWQRSTEPRLLELADRMGLLTVAGGPITHARPDHFPAQDILVCAHTLCTVDELVGRKPARAEGQPHAVRMPERGLNAERYLRTVAEMKRLWADHPDLLANTLRVAEMVDDEVLPPRTKLPSLYEDDNYALKEIVLARAREAYSDLGAKQIKRLKFELDRICTLGYAGHFLTAYDFSQWAREQNIQQSGRGSVIDSAVAYVLGFSRIDAIRHNLHFNRFLPADGTKRPDLDIDFEAHRRDDVRNYLIRKYGLDRVGQVCAVGAYNSRGIIRAVGKALALPEEAIGYLAKRIHGSVPPDQILSALERKPELKAAGIEPARFRWVFTLAQRLMDVPKDMRCHSSGVVISSEPLQETVPVQWSASPAEGGNLRLIQWDKRSAKYYFDKFDILCLRGQDVLSGTERHVRQLEPDFDVQRVPVDDPETYRTFRSGELIGIPQSASPAMRQAHVRLRTQDLDDASLVQAGIRPGVGGAVKMNELIARRRGKPYSFEHPLFEEILGNTYGIIVFQEQVDQLLERFGGYTSGEAEDLRDSIHKRRREDYGQKVAHEIRARVVNNGFSEAVAEQVYEYVAGFKGYGFAQGHALAFAEVSIRSVWCQQNFPAEYFAALLSSQPAGYYGPCTIANEARSRGVQILPPDVNASEIDFKTEDALSQMDPQMMIPNGAIRTGLMQVSSISQGLRERITQSPRLTFEGVSLRFRSIFDFCQRVQPNRDELEQLILAGAFDSLHDNRRALMWGVPSALEFAKPSAGPNPELPFFYPDPNLPQVADYRADQRAIQEREVLGMDVKEHLMAFERARVASRGGIETNRASRLEPGKKAMVVGNPIRLRFPPTPSGKRVVFFDLEDETGILNVTAFDETYQRDGHAIVCSPYVTLIGESQDRDGHIAFLAHRVFPYHPLLGRDRTEPLPLKVADFLVG